VPLVDVVLGTTLEVPTLKGSANVHIPSGTQADSVFRLKAKGLPEFGTGRPGDLCIRIHVVVPERLSKQERLLYEKLREISKENNLREKNGRGVQNN
jgi:molecular chaperone DnaJ